VIARLRRVRLRLVHAVALGALALLVLKAPGLWSALDQVPLGLPSGVVQAPDQLPPFARMLSHARTNYVPPEVTMTGAVPDKPKPEPAAPPPEPAQVPPRPASLEAAPASESERALLERLGGRRDELNQRNRDLEMRERLLENAERKIEGRINELKALEDKADEAAAKRADGVAQGLRNLVTMYETMKPKDAARIFDRLQHDVLIPVVLQMNPRKMAEVLAVMAPEAAEKLTVALALRAKGVERSAAAAPPTPARVAPDELPSIDPAAPRR
jgi:flagellar motility protein MotE (MotC chaperone)